MKDADGLLVAAEQFAPGQVLAVQEYGSGNINDTYLVTTDAPADARLILQRINTRVFPRPALIMHNLRVFTDHVVERLRREPTRPGRRWVVPRVLRTRDGQDFFVAADGSFWRALSFVDHARTFDAVQSLDHAREVGYALGRFQDLISDLDVARLHDTLPGFLIAPYYLARYDEVVARCAPRSGPAVDYCHRCVAERRAWASVLEDARDQGRLRPRPIHGDPKVNNFMMDETTGQAVSIVDLDTVKPGLVHYDIGDCLRSCCNPLGEETRDVDAVRFDITLCRAILEGYLPLARRFLDENDYLYLYDCIRLLAFELGLRFFTDYLAGNVYYKVKSEDHNLWRALVQFRLTESIEAQETAIRALIDELR